MLTSSLNTVLFAFFSRLLASTNAEEDYQRVALELHNEFRAVHQAGSLRSSDKLNKIAVRCAQYYADKGFCDTKCPFLPTNTDQSCYWERRVLKDEEIVRSSIEAWSGEECKYDYNKEGQPETRNFSLMVWLSSQKLGFGVGRHDKLSYGCALYSPAGNIIGQDLNNVFRSNTTHAMKC